MTLIPARVASRLRSGGRANLDWDKNDFMTVHLNGITQTRFNAGQPDRQPQPITQPDHEPIPEPQHPAPNG